MDENDNVIAAIIASMSEEYVIVANAVGKELFELEHRVVKAYDVIGEDSEGVKLLLLPATRLY